MEDTFSIKEEKNTKKEENEKEEEELVEKSEEIYEILTNDIITNKEEETGLEVCKKENLKDHLF